MTDLGERLVEQVDALWSNGPPARGVAVVIAFEGLAYFEVRALALRCAGCGTVVPQSRSRVAPEARRLWLLHHVACTDASARAAPEKPVRIPEAIVRDLIQRDDDLPRQK